MPRHYLLQAQPPAVWEVSVTAMYVSPQALPVLQTLQHDELELPPPRSSPPPQPCGLGTEAETAIIGARTSSDRITRQSVRMSPPGC
jgi:hypothetical protein